MERIRKSEAAPPPLQLIRPRPGLFEERKLENAMKRIRDGDARSFHFFLRGGNKASES